VAEGGALSVDPMPLFVLVKDPIKVGHRVKQEVKASGPE